MLKTEKNCLPVNNSNPQTTDVHDTDTNEKANAFYFQNLFTFAMHSTSKGGGVRLLIAGFFYACALQLYGSVPPRNFIMKLLPFGWNAAGQAEPFFISAINKQI